MMERTRPPPEGTKKRKNKLGRDDNRFLRSHSFTDTAWQGADSDAFMGRSSHLGYLGLSMRVNHIDVVDLSWRIAGAGVTVDRSRTWISNCRPVQVAMNPNSIDDLRGGRTRGTGAFLGGGVETLGVATWGKGTKKY